MPEKEVLFKRLIATVKCQILWGEYPFKKSLDHLFASVKSSLNLRVIRGIFQVQGFEFRVSGSGCAK